MRSSSSGGASAVSISSCQHFGHDLADHRIGVGLMRLDLCHIVVESPRIDNAAFDAAPDTCMQDIQHLIACAARTPLCENPIALNMGTVFFNGVNQLRNPFAAIRDDLTDRRTPVGHMVIQIQHHIDLTDELIRAVKIGLVDGEHVADLQDARLDCVQKALAAYSVKTNICLSGYEFPNSSKGESMPIVSKAIEANGNFLSVNIDYNLVYYHSDASEYSNALRKICKFIIEHPGAFYINCRLGSDRTGAICAVIASLCGASWSDIAEDYEKTIRAGIGEYRNRKLLQYSIKNMTGTDPVDAGENLSEVMQDYFVKEKILTSSEIKKLVKKLNIEIKPEDGKYLDF